MRLTFRATILGAAASSTLVSAAAMAQYAHPAANVRGTVVGLNGNSLQVRSREGGLVGVTLADGWTISTVAQVTLAAIKPGDYVGIASLPNGKGDRALEVLIFPPALNGLGEGSYGWDLKPRSSMTNASVTNLVKGVDGRTVTLSYNGGRQKTIVIPDDAPVVTVARATPDDLKPDAPVFIPTSTATDGKLSARQVVVGTNGVALPM